MSDKKLDLNSFNDILFGAFKEQTPQKKKDLLIHELKMTNTILDNTINELLDELEEINYQSELFTRLHNIKSNMEHIMDQIYEIDKELGNEN